MASGFWGVTGFFIILEVAMTLGVQFTPGKKDDKQCVAAFTHVEGFSGCMCSKRRCQ
jgi:hypothetical protein